MFVVRKNKIYRIGERQVPDPLKTFTGENIQSADEWHKKRKPEVIQLFEKYIYGTSPRKKDFSLRFELIEKQKNLFGGLAIRKDIDIIYQSSKGEDRFRMYLYLPQKEKKPHSTFLFINVRGYEVMDPDKHGDFEFWPITYLLSRGYATAGFQVSEVAPDDQEKAFRRAHKVFSRDYTWGAISAWAWGASRVMDYLETDSQIATDQVCVIGHSRGGKAALWAGALDERFSLTVSNNSGSTGAAIARGKIGETIKDINTRFPYWFNDLYKTFNDREDELPVDQHMLISSIAPRSVYVISATNDDWADPTSEFLSLIYAKPVYKLFGYSHEKIKSFPSPAAPIYDEALGYHIRTGDHDLTLYDWEKVIEYWESRP